MRAEITLYSDMACKGGRPLAAIGEVADEREGVVGVLMHFALDGTMPTLTLVAARDCRWVPQARELRVLRVEEDDGTVTEWRINRRRDGAGESGALVHLEAFSPLIDLTTAGLVRVVQGLRTYYNLGVSADQPAAPGVYVDNFVLTNRTEDDLEWLGRGIIEPVERKAFSWERWNRLQVLREIEARWPCELQLRRDGDDGYLIDILSRDEVTGAGGIGGGAQPVLVTVDRNLIDLERLRDTAEFASVVVPTGDTPDGDPEPAGIGSAVWRVAAVSTGVVTLANPESGGPPPARFPAQLDGLYLRGPDGALTEILSTIVDGAETTVEVVDASGLSEGDLVEIRADAHGTYLSALRYPAAVDAIGRVVREVGLEGYRGERTYIPNASMEPGPDGPIDVLHGRVDGAQNNVTSLACKDFPPGTEFRAGDVLTRYGSTNVALAVRLTQDATVDANGDVTLELSGALSYLDGDMIYVHRLGGRMPVRWAIDASTTRMAAPAYRNARHQGSLSCEADGAYTTVGPVLRQIALRGLSPGDVIQFGDWLVRGTGRFMIFTNTQADEDGKAVVAIAGQISGNDGDALTIERPSLDARTHVLCLPRQVSSSGTASTYVETGAYAVDYYEGVPPLWVTVELTLRGNGTISAAGPNQTPLVQLLDADTNAVLASRQWPDEVLSGAVDVSRVLSFSYELTQTRRLKLRIFGVRYASGVVSTIEPLPVTMVRRVMLHAGTQEAVPYTAHSHATALWTAGNEHLARLSRTPTTYRLRMVDLERLMILPRGEERLTLGGRLVLVDAELGLEAEARVIALDVDPLRPENTEVLVDTAPARLSRYTRARPDKLFVSLSVTNTTVVVSAAGTPTQIIVTPEQKTATATPTAPSDQEGSLRLDVPDEDADGGTPTDGSFGYKKQVGRGGRGGGYVVPVV